jgi:hypothetical protein
MRPYEGLLTAMVTPFHADGRVNEEAAVALGRHLLANGSDGLVVAGTTGEATTLTDGEHIGLIELIASELGEEGAIVGGAGSNDTRHAIELTEKAIAAGAHAVLSVTGYYNKPNQRGIRRHYEEVARAAGGTPIILYNIPGRTAQNLPPDFLAELAQIDGVEAVKQANDEDLGPIDGLAGPRGQRQLARASPGLRRRGRHLRGLAHRRTADAEDVRRARAARRDRRRAAAPLPDALHHGESRARQGGAEPARPRCRRAAPAARGV